MTREYSAGPLFNHSASVGGNSQTSVLFGLFKHKHEDETTTFSIGPWGLLFYYKYNAREFNFTLMIFLYFFYLSLTDRARTWFCLPLLSFMRYKKGKNPSMWGFLLLGLLGIAISCAGKIIVMCPLLLTYSFQTGSEERRREFTTCLLVYWRVKFGKYDSRIIWPFYGRIHWMDEKKGFWEHSVLWPFFRYRHKIASGTTTLHLFWPFFMLVKMPEKFALRFLPFTWIKKTSELNRGFILLVYWEINKDKKTVGVFPFLHIKRDLQTGAIKTVYAFFMGMYRTTETTITMMITPLWWSWWQLSPSGDGYDSYMHMLLPVFAYRNYTPSSEQKQGTLKYFENYMLCIPILATLISYRPRDSIISIFVMALAWYYSDEKRGKRYVYGTVYGQYQRGSARYHSVLIVLALWKEGLTLNDLDVWVLFGLIRYKYDGSTKDTVHWFLPFYYLKHDEKVELSSGDYGCTNFTLRILILFKIDGQETPARQEVDSVVPPPKSYTNDDVYSYNPPQTTTTPPPPSVRPANLPPPPFMSQNYQQQQYYQQSAINQHPSSQHQYQYQQHQDNPNPYYYPPTQHQEEVFVLQSHSHHQF